MAKYLIHASTKRLWYVQEYLIPSMLEQGIVKNNISVYVDVNNEGCLESCMKAFLSVPIDNDGTWHLQDDVIVCSDFKERIEELDSERIVCGFCYENDDRKKFVGKVGVKHLWYSFPCIRIPNQYAREYSVWVKVQKNDDSMFDIYLQDYHGDEQILNVVPNLVDHVDYLIGGSIVNNIRPEKETHSMFFKDRFLIDELERKKVEFLCGNLIDPLIDKKVKLDVLICNPPYIENIKNIDKQVWDYEPHLALIASPATKCYEEIFKDAHKVMKEHYLMAFEIEEDMEKPLIELMNKYLAGCTYRFHKDLYDKTRFLYIIK